MKFVKTSFIPKKKINLDLVNNSITSEKTNNIKKINIYNIKIKK